jgi:hypothetical protein
MVRVAFLRRIFRSFGFSRGFRAFIISGLEGMLSRWCLAAAWALSRFTSHCVGEGRSISAFMTSRTASSEFKAEIPQ